MVKPSASATVRDMGISSRNANRAGALTSPMMVRFASENMIEGLGALLFLATGQPEEPSYWLGRHFYNRAGEPKDCWAVPGAAHGQIPALRPEEYEARIVTFFDRALLGER